MDATPLASPSLAGPEENFLRLPDGFDPALPFTELRLPDGRIHRIATALLLAASEPGPASGPEMPGQLADRTGSPPLEGLTIPLVEERLEIGKRTVTTGRVSLQKSVEYHDVQLDETLAERTFDIERVVLNRPVDSAPGVRHEGQTTIYPVVEEQLILTRQLVLREEVHVTQRDAERRDQQRVTLAREHLVVERLPGDREF